MQLKGDQVCLQLSTPNSSYLVDLTAIVELEWVEKNEPSTDRGSLSDESKHGQIIEMSASFVETNGMTPLTSRIPTKNKSKNTDNLAMSIAASTTGTAKSNVNAATTKAIQLNSSAEDPSTTSPTPSSSSGNSHKRLKLETEALKEHSETTEHNAFMSHLVANECSPIHDLVGEVQSERKKRKLNPTTLLGVIRFQFFHIRLFSPLDQSSWCQRMIELLLILFKFFFFISTATSM